MLSISLDSELDIRTLTELTSRMAVEMGFDTTDAAEITLGVSEIAQNTIRYAGKGKATIYQDTKILKVTIADNGPGIENIERALKKGYSSAKASLGIGLDVAQRSVDEFEIDSRPNVGTKVSLTKFMQIPDEQIEYGIVSFADENYGINGDDYLIKEYDGDKVLLAVIDGTGEGYPAHTVSVLIKEYLSTHYRENLASLIYTCDFILKENESERGAAIALAKIENGKLYYLGLGDTHSYVVHERVNTLFNQEGTVGLYQLPTLREKCFTIEPDSCIVMCTDGIKSNVSLHELGNDSAQQIANNVFKNYHKDYGDVTVLVTKYFGGL